MSERVVYLNGEYVPESEARISVLDRGFLFADGVYEVIPVYGGCLLREDEHLQRLARSLEQVRLSNPLSLSQWKAVFAELLRLNPGSERGIYLQVTRGVARRDHAFPKAAEPTVLVMVNPMTLPDVDLLKTGVAAVTLSDDRWSRCDIKSISLLPNVLARQQAVEQGAAEAILIRQGLAVEGAASNLFVVADGVIVTPPKDRHLLPGITRDLVIELAQQQGYPVMESVIPEDQLKVAQEIWVTSSTREILPVTRLNGAPVGDGKPGPVWQQMHAHYQHFKKELQAQES